MTLCHLCGYQTASADGLCPNHVSLDWSARSNKALCDLLHRNTMTELPPEPEVYHDMGDC